MPACPECGLDPASISPPDAVVALRSLPRRFREALPAEDDPERTAAVLAEAGLAAEAIAAFGADVRAVLVQDAPALGPHPIAGPGDLDTALARLASATGTLADFAEHQAPADWARAAAGAAGASRTAAELLGEAVHAGVHHLRRAESS